MNTKSAVNLILALLLGLSPLFSQNQALKTPLSQEILDLLVNEISGQIIFNNEVILAGAPWIRDAEEFSGTSPLYESQKMLEIAKAPPYPDKSFKTKKK